ncbi:DDE-type integrase/transposase/recombinase [Phyllobacterium sophorae]|uniref:DDE-type integrase/transposase/recombinase n=1 Tax=Phyllobacterium sophorae TaxID=1520277 RepID=UPI00147342C6
MAAVDQDQYVLEEIVQTRRNTQAAKRLLVRLLKKQGLAPNHITTDKLRSYGAAKLRSCQNSSIAPSGSQQPGADSHVPLRNKERMMQGFRSPGGVKLRLHQSAISSSHRNGRAGQATAC